MANSLWLSYVRKRVFCGCVCQGEEGNLQFGERSIDIKAMEDQW
jgi:hypothetical protein